MEARSTSELKAIIKSNSAIEIVGKNGLASVLNLGHRRSVNSVAMSPRKDKLIATGSSDRSIMLWRSSTGELLRKLADVGHVTSIAFSRDGTILASCSTDKTVNLWDVDTGDLLRSLTHSFSVNHVTFSETTVATASNDQTVCVWDIETGQCLHTLTHRDAVRCVTFSPNGERLASTCDDSSISLWDAATGERIRVINNGSLAISVAFSPDGATIAAGSYDKSIALWNVSSGRRVRSLYGHRGYVSSVAYSPNGEFIVSGSDDETCKVWVAATGRLHRTIEGHTDAIQAVAIGEDNDTIATASSDTTVRLSSAATGDTFRAIEAYSEQVYSVNFSPDGRTLCCCSRDKAVKLWSISVQADDTKVVPTASDEEAHALLDSVNRQHVQAMVKNLCGQPIGKATAFRLAPPGRVGLSLDDLKAVAAHIEAEGIAPRSFEVKLVDPKCLVTLANDQFNVNPRSKGVQAVADQLNESCFKESKVDLQWRIRDLQADVIALKRQMVGLHTAPDDIRLPAVTRAASVADMLHGHPLLTSPDPVDPVPTPTPSLARYHARLAAVRADTVARRHEYQRVIAEAEHDIEGLTARVKWVKADFKAATTVIEETREFEPESMPEPDEMAQILADADTEVDRPALEVIRTEFRERYKDLRDFLRPELRAKWDWATAAVERGDDTTALEETVGRLKDLIAEGQEHLKAFDEALLVQQVPLADVRELKVAAAELQADIEYLSRKKLTGQLADAKTQLDRVMLAIEDAEETTAMCTPQLMAFCPELKGRRATAAKYASGLRNAGLGHLLGMQELRPDLVLADFTPQSTVQATSKCQVVRHNGETLFAKTFSLDTASRPFLETDLDVLGRRMVHSPAVPVLRHVIVEVENGACTLVTEYLPDSLGPGRPRAAPRDILHGLLTAIHDLHCAGVCHRDLKPNNVRLRAGVPVLVGFEPTSGPDDDDQADTTEHAFISPAELHATPASFAHARAADVFRAGLVFLSALAKDSVSFCGQLLTTMRSNLTGSKLTTALLETVKVPEALTDVITGLLTTSPDSRWSARRALAHSTFEAVNPGFTNGAAEAMAKLDHARRSMHDPAVSVALADVVSTLTALGSRAKDVFAAPVMFSGQEAACKLSALVDAVPATCIGSTAPSFRNDTLLFSPAAMDVPMDELHPVLVGLGRMLGLCLLDGIRLPGHMVDRAWLTALSGHKVGLDQIMPTVHGALQSSVAEAMQLCPLDGFEGDVEAFEEEVVKRYTDRMAAVRTGLGDRLSSMSVAHLEALLLRPSRPSIAAIDAALRFDEDDSTVRAALLAALEEDRARFRFVQHVFGGRYEAEAVEVVSDCHRRVYRGLRTIHVPRTANSAAMRRVIVSSAELGWDGR
ncbi:HET-E [Carpediemonas membranifera]|uniref:HET-E n=1 Tax=Carpediemonas membranifera TaxID=201153 RepID=A0A8J6B8V8_9EUKA|nr:HET-E [Carpediemonas membranifera]|eukprot:KAG9396649.1 HET-E [Carpediemonas membranifera]